MQNSGITKPENTAQPVRRINFNRPPRIRPVLTKKTIILPKPPREGGQGRGGAILSSLLISGTMIGASYFVSQTRGTSPVFLLITAATAVAFLVVSIAQWIADYRERRRERREYRRALRRTAVEFIQLYIDEQSTHQYIHPVLTKDQAVSNAQLLYAELCELINTFLPRSIWQRLLSRHTSPNELGIEISSTHQEKGLPPCLLAIAGCDEANQPSAFKNPQPRLWERRPGDADALTLRVGTISRPAGFSIDSRSQLERDSEVEHLCERFLTVRNQPFTVSLIETGSLGVAGVSSIREQFTHSLVWQIITHHAPSEVRIAALYDPAQHGLWQRLIRAPHFIPLNGDRLRRMFPETQADIERSLRLLIDELGQRSERGEDETIPPPRLVLVVDNDKSIQQHPVLKELLRRGKDYGIHSIVICDSWDAIPGECGAAVRLHDQAKAELVIAGNAWSDPFTPLLAPIELSDQLGRALIRLTLNEMGGDREIPRAVRLHKLLQKQVEDFDFIQQWRKPIALSWHADVPIGAGERDAPMYLDLNDEHDGPHGIVAGKTGAGKSELLQSIITSIAATHGPDRAEFLLIDFKGGAALRIFADLPHTVGLVTDLQDRRLAERAITAMRSELRRRKEILKEAGEKVQNIKDYRALLGSHQPLANLLIIIDEFDTMVREQPGFVDELITVVKQGRSLGVHLLVATQQPSIAVKDEIKGQLNYWLALRLGSVADSREMLQRPDAFFLPSDLPGRAYKRVGTKLELFQAARISAPFQDDGGDDEILKLRSWASGNVQRSTTLQEQRPSQERDIDVLAQKIKEAGKQHLRRSIWSPPLPTRLTLSQRLPGELQVLSSDKVSILQQALRQDLTAEPMISDDTCRSLQPIPLGLLDVPQASQQEILHLDLQSGHLLVFGAPASGKTLLIQTILLSLGVTISPSQAWCYVINASGQGLTMFDDLPHVGGVVSVRDVEKVRRVLSMIQRQLEMRESPQEDSTNRTSSNSQQVEWPDIILIIDKFALFQTEYKDTELLDLLIDLAARGRSYRVHIILTADRPIDVPYRLQGLFEHRWSLRLTDEGDSVSIIGRKDAARIPIDVPGRGYVLHAEHGWLEFQIALPYIHTDKPDPAKTLEDELNRTAVEVENLLNAEVAVRTRDIIGITRRYWQIHGVEDRLSEPPKVEPLPGNIPFNSFWQKVPTAVNGSDSSECIIEAFFGLESQSLSAASFALSATNPTIFVGGGPGSGKTIALRTIVRSIALRYAPDDVDIILIDPRRTSFRTLPILPHEPLYARTESEIAEIAQRIEARLETDATTNRPVILCIDDYDVAQDQMSDQFQKPAYNATSKVNLHTVTEKALNLGRERGFFIVVAAKAFSYPRGILAQISDLRQGLILQPHNFPSASGLLGVGLPIPLGGRQEIIGRGLRVVNSSRLVVQVANDIG
jgi:S-DNA-T family DNA segregation ATPase FtsK/SpoIIIE